MKLQNQVFTSKGLNVLHFEATCWRWGGELETMEDERTKGRRGEEENGKKWIERRSKVKKGAFRRVKLKGQGLYHTSLCPRLPLMLTLPICYCSVMDSRLSLPSSTHTPTFLSTFLLRMKDNCNHSRLSIQY